MSYKENEVVAKFTKGNHQSNCKKYTCDDLLDMFDETLVTNLPFETTVNECITHIDLDAIAVCTIDLAVTEENGDMFCYAIDEPLVECSASLDYEFANESI